MASERSVKALVAYARDASERKQQQVLAAIQRLEAEQSHITVSRVARTAGVSREFVYSHAHLQEEIKSASRRSEHRAAVSGTDATSSHLAGGLRAEKLTLLSQVKQLKGVTAELRARITDLEGQRQRWLGSQLERREDIDPEAHSELRLANDRLQSSNTELNRQVQDLRRMLDVTAEELAASREAHLEDVAALKGPEVVPLRPAVQRKR